MKIQGSYKVVKWEEAPYDNISANSKLTRASVEYEFAGEIAGRATVEYLMFYAHFDSKDQHNSSATYVALIRFQGTVKERTGGFILRDQGAFQEGTARSTLLIAEGSGTGQLQGISGSGSYRADKSGAHIELDCNFA